MSLHFNPRDITWLAFNERVLQEAMDEKVPLHLRIRFLGIFSNNLDECTGSDSRVKTCYGF